MRIMDIGVNLMHHSFDRDRELVLRSAEERGVSPLVITGTGEESSRAAREYAAAFPGSCYATAGVHPHGAKSWGDGSRAVLRELAESPEVVAIGECGLDYNRDFSPREVQRRCFEEQIRLALELGLPLFLHERDAFADFSAILKQYRGEIKKMVVHCFTGQGDELFKYLELGCHIGITGWICDERRGRHLIPLIKKIPPDRLMLETDAPFLLPRSLPEKPRRSGRNESQYLLHIAETAARYGGKEPEQLAKETYLTSRRFFGLDDKSP
ncbi:MAG: TatD family hydrolase [Treponema sp.]|nr:TatD family hydrolase [Treponema sp.]